VGVHVKL